MNVPRNLENRVSKNLLPILEIELSNNNEVEDIETNGWYQSPLAVILKYRMKRLDIMKLMPLKNVEYIRYDKNSENYNAQYGEYEIYKCMETGHMIIGDPYAPIR